MSESFIESVMDDVEVVAKDKTPVDTGNARRGWRQRGGNVVNNTEYVSYLEDGHSKQAPGGIAGPTIKEINRRYKKGKYDVE